MPTQEEIAKNSVLVVGDVMLDRYWFGDVERISPEAPVPVVKIGKEEDRLGGAANVALNIKTLGGKVALMSVVGNDDNAARLRRLLDHHGVESTLGSDNSVTTIMKLRIIGRSQQLLRVDFEKEPGHEVLAQLLETFEHALPQHEVILFSDYGKGGLAHIPRMIELARRAGKTVLIDPKGSDYQRYAGASIITPNRAELALVTGHWKSEAELHEKAEQLRASLQLDHLLLTRSEEGMTLFSQDQIINFAAQAREVFDVTGAGDTVIGTLATMLACGLSMADSAQLANKAGGIVVGKFGTATLTHEELMK